MQESWKEEEDRTRRKYNCRWFVLKRFGMKWHDIEVFGAVPRTNGTSRNEVGLALGHDMQPASHEFVAWPWFALLCLSGVLLLARMPWAQLWARHRIRALAPHHGHYKSCA